MPAPVPTSEKDPQQTVIVRVYGALAASFLMMFVPSVGFALVASLVFIGVLIAAGIIRRRNAPDSLAGNHMIYVIRTIWIACLMSLVTLIAGGLVLWRRMDLAPVEPCAGPLSNYMMAQGESATAMEIAALLEPCKTALIEHNMPALVTASVITALPPGLYMVWRLWHGIGRAVRGYRIASPRRWL